MLRTRCQQEVSKSKTRFDGDAEEKGLGSGGIRTHAPEETGALNQRLRPLGHATMNAYQSRADALENVWCSPLTTDRRYEENCGGFNAVFSERLLLEGISSPHDISDRDFRDSACQQRENESGVNEANNSVGVLFTFFLIYSQFHFLPQHRRHTTLNILA